MTPQPSDSDVLGARLCGRRHLESTLKHLAEGHFIIDDCHKWALCIPLSTLQMLLYLRMVLPSSRTPPPQFSASSTNRRTTHLAGRRRQPLTPQTWASPAEPLTPRHVRLPLTPPPLVFPSSADEDTRSLTINLKYTLAQGATPRRHGHAAQNPTQTCKMYYISDG